MKKLAVFNLKLLIISLVTVLLLTSSMGCRSSNPKSAPATVAPSAQAASNPASTNKTAAPATSKVVAAAPASKSGTTTLAKAAGSTAVPKLNDIAYTLSLDPGQEYTGTSTPIFLRSHQILRMNWQVVKGGNHFHLNFSLPNGKLMAVRNNGTLAEYLSNSQIPEELTKNGSLVIRPADNDWEDGYYIFYSHILAGDAPVTIKLIYWIEG